MTTLTFRAPQTINKPGTPRVFIGKYMKIIFFLLGLASRIAIISIPLFVLNKYRDQYIQPLANWSSDSILYGSLSILILIVSDYAKDFIKDRKQKQNNPLQQVCRQTGATVTSLLSHEDKNKVIEDSLKHIESIVEITLGKGQKDGLEITANLMTYKSKRKVGAFLELTHWGTRLPGREPLTIPLKDSEKLPGAPTAFHSRKITYIADTESKSLLGRFDGKTYKSIISIPLIRGSTVIGIINIDAKTKNAFGKKMVNEDVRTLIQAQLDTISHLMRHSSNLAFSPQASLQDEQEAQAA